MENAFQISLCTCSPAIPSPTHNYVLTYINIYFYESVSLNHAASFSYTIRLIYKSEWNISRQRKKQNKTKNTTSYLWQLLKWYPCWHISCLFWIGDWDLVMELSIYSKCSIMLCYIKPVAVQHFAHGMDVRNMASTKNTSICSLFCVLYFYKYDIVREQGNLWNWGGCNGWMEGLLCGCCGAWKRT